MSKGNLTIIAGNGLSIISKEIEYNSTGSVTNIASQRVIRQGETGGRIFGDYVPIESIDSSIRIEDIITFKFFHRWQNAQYETNHLGDDIITVNEHRIQKTYKNGVYVDLNRYVTNYYVHISIDGDVDIARGTHYYHDFPSSPYYHAQLKNENTKGIVMENTVKTYAEGVAEYKKNNRGGSPVQTGAQVNRGKNKEVDLALSATSGLGAILGQIPHPYAKIGGKVLSGSKPVLKALFSKSEHADEVVIAFMVEYTKKEDASWEVTKQKEIR